MASGSEAPASPSPTAQKVRSRRPRSRHQRQLRLELQKVPGRGGRRRGAGRKPVGARRNGPEHIARPTHNCRHPVHVTLRARSGLPSFRSPFIYRQLERSLAAASRRGLRVLQFSVQTDHLHLVTEADSRVRLIRGIQGLAVRCARAVNRGCGGRKGSVWAHRYHAHHLATPREVRRALVYVLLNFRKHLRAAPAIDPRSSAAFFDGWKTPPTFHSPPSFVTVHPPTTWLASIGWRAAGGPIDVRESPA